MLTHREFRKAGDMGSGCRVPKPDLKTSTPTSPAHIDKIMTLFNGLNAAEQHLRATVGEERSDPAENTHVKQKHIQAIVGSLKHKLGANRDTLFNNATSISNNPFGTNRDLGCE